MLSDDSEKEHAVSVGCLCTLGEGVLDCDQSLRTFVWCGFPGSCTPTAGSPIEECSLVHEDDKKERCSGMYIVMAPAQICPPPGGNRRRQTGLRFRILSNIVFCFRCARAELGHGCNPARCMRPPGNRLAAGTSVIW